jgi:large conductance mechanosensitive channel
MVTSEFGRDLSLGCAREALEWKSGRMSGFTKFLLRGNLVDLAVAVVIGVAFTAVITALVKDIITPIIGIFGGLPDFAAWTFTINGSVFLIGDFINALLSFVIVAAVLYYLVLLPVQKIMDLHKSEVPAAPAETKACPYCLSKIPVAASKCAYCTSDVSAVPSA